MIRPSLTQRPTLWRRTLACLLLPGLVALGLALDATAAPRAKMDGYLRKHASQAADETPFKVIVTMRPGARRGMVQALKAQGAKANADFTLIEAFAASLPAGLLRALENNPDVVAISLDAPVEAHGKPTADPSGYTLRGTLGIDDTSGYLGSNVTVAVVDSGISPHNDFNGGRQSRIVVTRDFTQGGVATTPSDPYGHGTHIAGLIAGNGSYSSGQKYAGVAKNAQLVNLRVLDAYGIGRTSDVVSAIQWAVGNRSAYGIQVLNLSLGHPIYEPAATHPLVQAVEAAARAGIVVVASAGNYGINPATGQPGYAGISSPGNAPSAISVGAVKTMDTIVRSDDAVPPYSSRGPSWYDGYGKPDLVAPGHRLVAPTSRTSALCKLFPSLGVAGTTGKVEYPRVERFQHGRRGHQWDGRPHAGGQQGHLQSLETTHAECREGDAPILRLHHGGHRPSCPGRGRAQRPRGGRSGGCHRPGEGDRHHLARHRRHRVDHDWRRVARVGPEHRLGRQHRLGRHRLREPDGLGPQHRLG